MKFWWNETDETEMGNLLTELILHLKEDHVSRHTLNLDMLRMYTQRDYEDLRRGGSANRMNLEDYRMRLNVVGSITDTLVSRIGKSKPKPMYLTRRGDYKLRQNAKRLSDVMEGIFYQTGIFFLSLRKLHNQSLQGYALYLVQTWWLVCIHCCIHVP